jgi:hypothetical protein
MKPNMNMTILKKIWPLLTLITISFMNAACSSIGVKPWEKEVLSKKEMQFGANTLESSFEDHTFFSKEGSSGGRSFSAGGCGCN